MRLARLVCVAVWFAALTTNPALCQEDIAAKTRSDPDFRRGKAVLLEGNYAEAKHYLELAESHVGANSAEINAGIALAELQLGHYEVARKREAKVLALVANDHARAEAHNVIGTAWLRESGQSGSNGDQLQAAEQSFREAVRADPGFAAAYFHLGEVLLLESRDSDLAFKNFVDAAAAAGATNADDVAIQRQARAPEFSGVDSKGYALSSISLRGRVVLLDFWATWCPPCIRALPVMRELARHFPSDQFLLISVDEDTSDRGKWREFIANQKMDWTQVWDQTSRIYSSFGLAVHGELSLPRYVLVDQDGYVLRVYSGTDRLESLAGQAARAVRNVSAPAAKGPQ
jgi:thiol-disulfide isomerase/thioredoxin